MKTITDNITVTYVPHAPPVDVDGIKMPGHWEIEGVAPYTFLHGEPQRFTASLPECACARLGCSCRKAYSDSTRTHFRNRCHGWHQPKVDAFVAAVRRTYSARGLAR